MSENRKEKVVNFGITDELKNFLNGWIDNAMKENRNENKKIGMEVREAIVMIAKNKVSEIESELNKTDIMDMKWDQLIEKLDKISDLVRWY